MPPTLRHPFFVARHRLPSIFVVLALLASPALVIRSSTPVGAQPNDATCEGYSEPRVFLESQDWWRPTLNGTEDFGHVHAGTCFPRTHTPAGEPNKIRGTVSFNVRVVMHENPGVFRYLRAHITDSTSNTQVFRSDINERCVVDGPRWSNAASACIWWVPVQIDTTKSQHDGFQEFRFSAVVTQGNGDEMYQSSGFQAWLDNGRSVDHYRANSDGSAREFIEGRGWYDGAGYTNASLRSRLPYSVSGTWKPSVRMAEGSAGVKVSRAFASIDPNLHQGGAGTVLIDQAGSYSGSLSIDTTKLTDGVHRLFLRADAPCDGTASNDCGLKLDGSTNNVATSSGALVVSFLVQNGINTTSTTSTTAPSPSAPAPSPSTFTATADAYVDEAKPTRNFGSASSLRSRDSSTDFRCYVTFNVEGLAAEPSSAKVRLYVSGGSPDGGAVHQVSSTWIEQTLTWRTAPPLAQPALSRVGRVAAGTWVDYDVTPAVKSNGAFSFAISSTSKTSVIFNSRETAQPPQLVVTP